MHKWNRLVLILFAAVLAACNFNFNAPATTATPGSVISPTPAVSVPSATTAPTVVPTTAPPTANLPPTAASSATFPPVITATPPPPTATKPAPSVPTATPKPGVAVTEIKMVGLNNGWAIGYVNSPNDSQIFKTSDGGKNWKSVTPPEPSRSGKHAVAFFQDANRAWVNYSLTPSNTKPGDFTVWRTNDSGATWKAATTSLSGITMDYFAADQIGFFDANNGWLWSTLGVGMSHTYVAVYTTGDGGATWKLVVSPDKNNLQMSCGKNGVWFRDANHGYMAGNCYGVIKGLYLYATNDGGTIWSTVSLPAPSGLADAFTRDSNVCGADLPKFYDTQKGTLLVSCTDLNANKNYRWTYQTKDGGATWTSAALPRAFGRFFFLTQDTGWYLGQLANDNYTDVKVYQTTDGGKIWKEISATHWAGQQDYVDGKNGWVIATTGSGIALVRTVDGGLSYQLLSPQLLP